MQRGHQPREGEVGIEDGLHAAEGAEAHAHQDAAPGVLRGVAVVDLDVLAVLDVLDLEDVAPMFG